MQIVTVDKFNIHQENVALEIGGHQWIDLRNDCVLTDLIFDASSVQAHFVKIIDSQRAPIKTHVALTFTDARIDFLHLVGDLNDYTTLEHIQSLGDGKMQIEIADLKVRFSYRTMQVETEIAADDLWALAWTKYQQLHEGLSRMANEN